MLGEGIWIPLIERNVGGEDNPLCDKGVESPLEGDIEGIGVADPEKGGNWDVMGEFIPDDHVM